jgi:hypothetical protein
MLALALARRLIPGEPERQHTLAVAGLMHDIGELYIDPAWMRKGHRLEPAQWRHIVTHPLLAFRVLLDLAGAGRAVAEAVLLHHERLDGFGYPRGVSGAAFHIDGQVLAAAEWLMALVESGVAPVAPLTRARMATQLVPGEFSPALLDVVATAARDATDEPVELRSAAPLEDVVPRVMRIARTMQRFREQRAWIDARTAEAAPPLRRVLQIGMARMLRIQASFSSTGFDAQSPQLLLAEMAALSDPRVYIEIVTLIAEMEWRLRELEREQRLHASLLSSSDNAVVEELIGRLK